MNPSDSAHKRKGIRLSERSSCPQHVLALYRQRPARPDPAGAQIPERLLAPGLARVGEAGGSR